MTTMDQIHRIRELFYEQGKNLNEIAIIMNCDWRKRISSLHENSAILPKGSTSAWKAKTKIFPAATDWLPFTSDNGKKNSILTKQLVTFLLSTDQVKHRPISVQQIFTKMGNSTTKQNILYSASHTVTAAFSSLIMEKIWNACWKVWLPYLST